METLRASGQLTPSPLLSICHKLFGSYLNFLDRTLDSKVPFYVDWRKFGYLCASYEAKKQNELSKNTFKSKWRNNCTAFELLSTAP